MFKFFLLNLLNILTNFRITLQEESVDRSRPPRPIYNDKIIRSYKLKEAQAVYIYKVNLVKTNFLKDINVLF